MIIRVIDVETTGFAPPARVVEMGWTDVIVDADGSVSVSDQSISRLCDPGIPIPPEVSKIHGITDDMVAGHPAPATVFMEVGQGAHVFCAHNAEFEQRFFGGGECPWICTYKVALARYDGLSSYKNGNLPALLGIDLDPDRSAPLHRAGPDTYVTALILAHMLRDGLTVDEAIKISLGLKAVRHMPFGKHKGERIEDLPDSYLAWGIDNLDSKDIRAAMSAEIKRRNINR